MGHANITLSMTIFFQVKFEIVLSFKVIPSFHGRVHYLKVLPALSPTLDTINFYILHNWLCAEQKRLLIWDHVSLGSITGSAIHF